jgi:hypothetical protein
MTLVRVSGYQQGIDFGTGESKTVLTLAVGERRFFLEVRDSTDLDEFILAVSRAQRPVAAPEAEADGGTVTWARLPSTVLPEATKAVLRALNVPATVPLANFRSLVDELHSRLSKEDWEEITGEPLAAEPAPVQQTTRPPLQPEPAPAAPNKSPNTAAGAVTWVDGTPILPGAGRPARTVPKDEWGYPIVPNAGVDPREHIGSSDCVDEDGVGQL